MHDYILTLSCADRTGIVHAVSGWLLKQEGNILEAQQYGDPETKQFFLRIHFGLPTPSTPKELRERFDIVARAFNMDAHFYDAQRPARLLLLVSKQGHCLNDLLFRWRENQLSVDIAAVASNHETHMDMVKSYGIPYYHLPVTSETKVQQEQQILDLVDELNIDLVVLARYMQILTPHACEVLSGKAINIHHSFLPSFKGARPYHQAHARGVKIIGATAHYVTKDLDEGPIIEQDIAHVNHTMNAQDLTRVGSDIESMVLARAVKAHVEHRILLNGQRTIVFH
ncbi:MAG TPA: formyltetrahydrofolate deformylase [Paenalcaligenes sp.]|nr:formyltetrahydrofolate deformylase [Paenalcaligenes sp.]